MRFPVTAALLVAFASAAPAADVIQADTVTAVKRASVYIRTQNGSLKATGSGFVVASPEGALLVATNAHVVTSDEDIKLSAGKLLERTKAARVTVTFDSGSVAEQSVTAEIVAIDPAIDLALLKLKAADVKNPPKPLSLASGKSLVETATVYTFGYPFGDALATGKGPAVTVGKASISRTCFITCRVQ